MRTLNGVLIVAMMLVFAGSCVALAGKKKASSGNLSDVTVTKPTDKASPTLAKPLAKGKHFPEDTITNRKSDRVAK
jgi:type VI protein secretion system component Hcp